MPPARPRLARPQRQHLLPVKVPCFRQAFPPRSNLRWNIPEKESITRKASLSELWARLAGCLIPVVTAIETSWAVGTSSEVPLTINGRLELPLDSVGACLSR